MRRTTRPTLRETARSARRHPSGHRAGRVLAVCAVVVASCVTHVVEPEAAELENVDSVMIAPLGAPEDPEARAIGDYYRNVLVQLQDALAARDLPALRGLLNRHDRSTAPEWFREHVEVFRQMAVALEFELHAAEIAELRARTPDAALGEALVFELVIASSTRPDLSLPGVDAAVTAERFQVSVTVIDRDCYGDRTVRQSAELVSLQNTAAIGRGEPLVQPFGLPDLVPEGCLRRVSVEVEWLPGNLLVGDEAVPHGRVPLARQSFELYPRGIESVRENPYTNLRSALESGDPAHFDHVFLAACMMTDEYREDALRKLIHHLRVGRPDVARVCTAALAVVTGEDIPLGDRDAWLAWWSRRSAPR